VKDEIDNTTSLVTAPTVIDDKEPEAEDIPVDEVRTSNAPVQELEHNRTDTIPFGVDDEEEARPNPVAVVNPPSDVILPLEPVSQVHVLEPREAVKSNWPAPTEKSELPIEEHPREHGILTRIRARLKSTYYPSDAPALVYPTGPSDKEKYCYLRTNRVGLYVLGGISFVALSAGMWLFVLTGPAFYWFGGVVAFLELYLIVSYGISIIGKDFDFEEHKKILDENPLWPESAPTVDIYLPCCKEPNDILENTYKCVQAVKYFSGKLQVHVLDDGGLGSVKTLAEQYGFNYITRDDKPRLKKAENLR